MVFNSKDIPKIKIKEINKGNIEVALDYTSYVLYRDGKLEDWINIHSNKEAKEYYSSYDLGYGNILISGLGFGILNLWLAKKEKVKSIKIIEISQDIVETFLKNNKLPENVTIEIADIEEYKTKEKYDCIFLDHHYTWTSANHKIKSIKNIAKNIPNHNLIWLRSIEDVYLRKCYDGMHANLATNEAFFQQKDFSEQWDFFRNNIIKLNTFPEISADKINEYIYTYADFLNSKYVLKR
jgi:hypothetical protein